MTNRRSGFRDCRLGRQSRTGRKPHHRGSTTSRGEQHVDVSISRSTANGSVAAVTSAAAVRSTVKCLASLGDRRVDRPVAGCPRDEDERRTLTQLVERDRRAPLD
jgi:hypothetical protein